MSSSAADAALPALKPLFMWAGGKRRLIPKYAPYLPELTQLRAYVEPFLGGGALFAHVAAVHPGIHAVLGEVNREVAHLYAAVKQHPEELLRAVKPYEAGWACRDIPDRKAWYYTLRQKYWDLPEGLEATALLYFLMKTGFNGIWQTCQNSKGRYGTPVGLAAHKGPVIDPALVHAWSQALIHTEVKVQPYEKTKVVDGAFVYCDPPYRGSFTSYGTGFNDDQQKALITWCRQVAQEHHALVWLANRETGDGFFETWAPDAKTVHIPVVYTAGRRKQTDTGYEAKPATEILLQWDGRHTQ
jgi:DNA adenine methylase